MNVTTVILATVAGTVALATLAVFAVALTTRAEPLLLLGAVGGWASTTIMAILALAKTTQVEGRVRQTEQVAERLAEEVRNNG